MTQEESGQEQLAEWAAAEEPLGQALRRGTLRPGDRVQITDSKGKQYTITLVPGGEFQTVRGTIRHDDLLGKDDGQVVRADSGRTFQVIRPLLSDYVLSMPRGATIVYPKDAAQIIQMGDIFPGAAVLEAGVGSGALAMALLSAIGPSGKLLSVEKREDFAAIAQANVDLWFGARHPAWAVKTGDVGDVAASLPARSLDRVVFDLLDPWTFLPEVARVLLAGGVFVAYVATVTQMSRLVEEIRQVWGFTDPQVWENLVRPWHVEGLAVRPEHRMIGHTGFLITARRLGDDTPQHHRDRRPARAAEGLPGMWEEEGDWSGEKLGTPEQNPKRTRRVIRDLESKTDRWLRD